MLKESENLEFKQEVTNDFYKEVVAFTNTDGGIILVGVNDDGGVVPLGNVDETYLKITNGIRDNITPDVTMFVKYTLDEQGFIKIEIAEGTNKPYYLKAKGLKPSGVFVRQGTSSVGATPAAIRQMIKDADGDVFEEHPSLIQNLTFNQCKDVFERRGIDFDESKFDVLGIFDTARNVYSNLGLLLSDQCQHTIKIAVFDDVANTIFKGRKEFSGSLLKQIDDAFEYIELNNNVRSTIKGLVREDFEDYPVEALRESLINAVIHRNYDSSGSIIVNINNEFMEFISIGGLMPELTQAEMLNGVSVLRNKRLSAILLRLRIIEAYGTGVRRIFNLYQIHHLEPFITDTTNSFKITLPNINHAKQLEKNSMVETNMNEQEGVIIHYLEEFGELTDEKIQELLDVKKTRAFVVTKQMVDKGLVKVVGRGQNRRIVLS